MIGSAYSEVTEILAAEGDGRLDELVRNVPNKDELLLDASYALDEPVVAAALRAGAEPNARSASIGGQGAESALHRAVRGHGTGSFEAVAKMLVDAGADLRARNSAKDTPLHAAIYEGEQRALTLVRLGADPAVLDDASQPMLIKAILLNFMELADLLLARGVPIDVRDEQGQTALLVATRERRLSAIRFLLDRGADPNAADYKQVSAKRVAMDSEDPALEAIFNPPKTAAVHAASRPKMGCSLFGLLAASAIAVSPILIAFVQRI